jgi:hypothetical protein
MYASAPARSERPSIGSPPEYYGPNKDWAVPASAGSRRTSGSLLGNVQAGGLGTYYGPNKDWGVPDPAPAGKVSDYFTGSTKNGVINAPGIIDRYAPIDEQMFNQYHNFDNLSSNEQYKADPAFGEAKGASTTTIGSGIMGPTPNWVPDILDTLVGIPQSFAAGLAQASYQLQDDGFTRKALGDWAEQMRGYVGSRFRREDIQSAEDAWKSGRITDEYFKNRGYGASMSNPNKLNKDKRDYRLGQRQKAQTAREAIAKAQAVADAKAKVEAEQARQTEKEKQRMVDNKSFSDTDSGSFDEGGNYSDWGSKEEYDDDFGADSTWGDDGGDSGGSSGGGGGGGSYIATATTQALGEEGLTVFNNWRDHMRNVVPEFTVSFGRYRVTAPKIVKAIDKKDNSKAIYKDIWDKHLKPIYDLIVADKDSVKAQDDYRVMVRELSNKHLKDK